MSKKSLNPAKILVILGPTSSGKSELAVKLAKQLNGEILSCDSRQVYRGLDIGSGKVPGKWQAMPFPRHPGQAKRNPRSKKAYKLFTYKGIIHHGIDIASPKRRYSVARFQKYAKRAVAQIIKRKRLPILCGGTGHWMDAVVYNQRLPNVKPDAQLRKKLGKKSAADLYQLLKKLDPARAKNIDAKNPRRLIRALEIVMISKKPVPNNPSQPPPSRGGQAYIRGGAMGLYDVLWLGIKIPQKTLFDRIKKRLQARLKQGMLQEIKRLHSPPARGGVRGGGRGLSWKRLENFGLEYKFCALYLQGKLSKKNMLDGLFAAIKRYSKRQETWFKKNPEIHWLTNQNRAPDLTKKFLN